MHAKELDALAVEVVQSVKLAMAPVLARVATLERDLKSANDRCSEFDATIRSMASAESARDFTANAVREAIAPLLERNAALEMRLLELETRPPQVGPVGPAGEKGLTGERGEMGPQGERGVDGKDGRDGLNGKDGAPGERGLQGEKGDVGPVGPQGEKGIDGKDGAPGLNGKDGAPGERGPQGEKGLDGMAGRDGRDGAPGPAGTPGEKGLDGRNGVDGINGKDGRDGLGFDDFDLVLDETRGWILRLAQGERVKEFALPMPFFRGNWEAGTTYPKGAGVRWDGHYWWALTQTHEQPGEGSKAWQMVVSRGKQGREGKQGKEGAPGRDLTQIDPSTGRKW